jgi:hypothetical protein
MSDVLEINKATEKIEAVLVSAQTMLTKLRLKHDCHRIMDNVKYAIKGLYPPAFLDSIFRIKFFFITDAESSIGVLKEINAYCLRKFRIYSQGIGKPFETHKYFGHSVLAWWCAPIDKWYVIDALLMPIAEIGFGVQLEHYLYLIVHHNEPEPVLVVPVITGYGLGQTCIDSIRMTDNVGNMVDNQTGALFPEVAAAYKGDFMV